MAELISTSPSTNRLQSLDFFRGLTMFLLIGGGSGIYELLQNSDNNFLYGLGWQFEHPEWIGLKFYDFIAPFFMFIVGCAIPFSVSSRLAKGESWKKLKSHAYLRFAVLFVLGIVCYSIDAGKPVLKLWNILTQVSVAYLLAFLILQTKPYVQIIISFSLIVISQLLYLIWNVEGFNHPFVAGQNFGTWWDLKLMGITEGDHWVSFNVVATSAQVIWGSLAGSLLLSQRTPAMKLKVLLVAGLIGILTGLALSPVIPFIKKIATASVIIETGGWCFVMLGFSYWLVDMKLVRTIPGFFAVVGMNSLFIYFLFQIGFGEFLSKIALPFSKGAFFWAGGSIILYVNALLTWLMMWYLCYFLYKKKIFIRI